MSFLALMDKVEKILPKLECDGMEYQFSSQLSKPSLFPFTPQMSKITLEDFTSHLKLVQNRLQNVVPLR